MTRTRTRSPSPDNVAKRVKSAHPSPSTPSVGEDPTPHFSSSLFDHNNIARLNSDYLENTPFKYAVVEKLFQDELLKSVKDECLAELNFTLKETDIYKVNSAVFSKYHTPRNLVLCYLHSKRNPMLSALPSHMSRSNKQATLLHSISSPHNKYPNSHHSSSCGMPCTRFNSATFFALLPAADRSREGNKTCPSTLTPTDAISSTTTT
jgi:hypothetical protein